MSDQWGCFLGQPAPRRRPAGGSSQRRATSPATQRQDRRVHIATVHAATAPNRGIPAIVSPDEAFDDVTGLIRLDPIDTAAELPG